MTSSVVAWIGAEMEFALSQAVASGDAFEHRPSECGHCVQNFLADLDFRDLPGEAAGFELGADDTLPTADLRFYPAALVLPYGACTRIRSWLVRPQTILIHPGVRHADILFDLLKVVGGGGNLTTDAHLAALAIEHQAELHSTDADMARFPGLRWVNPLA